MWTRRGAGRVVALLLATTALTGIGTTLLPMPALAQTVAEQVFGFAIGAKPVRQGLNDISRITGLSVVFSETDAASGNGNAVSGTLTPQQALDQLLSGTGLNWHFANADTVTISSLGDAGPLQVDDGSILIDTIQVVGIVEGGSVYAPYETDRATAFISSDTIERYRGSSPGDIFRGTPGVMSGDARNSAGAIDVNVRGLQGMGRVKVTVDDAENAVTIYQGYQGQSNRTYVDPDFIAGIEVNKGGDVASRGMAGSVAMRTVSASDIIRGGDTWGMVVKGSTSSNTAEPTKGTFAGYIWPSLATGVPVASTTGLDRPSVLAPTNGAGSVVVAAKDYNWDILAGYAYRKRGNYFAGSNGGDLLTVNPVARTIRNADGSYTTGYFNEGYTNYRPGEEVLNTASETRSFLAKANFRFGQFNDQTLQFSYNNFESESGYLLPVFGANTTPEQNRFGATTGTRLDTGTVNYRWNPEDNDLIDFKINGWATYFQLLNDPRLVTDQYPETYGLDADYRTGTNTMMWGGEITNRSRLFLGDWGDLDLTYGGSYIGQDVGLGRYADVMSFLRPSQGTRDEVSGFLKAQWKPTDWLTLNGGLRYSRYWADGPSAFATNPAKTADGWSPSAGITVEPLSGVQLYANYASTLRLPSLVETIGLFTVVEDGLKPERLNSIDVGVNLSRDGVITGDDRTMLKLGYFNWDVQDYISRATQQVDNGTSLRIHNIAGAKFSGLEMSGRYELDGFAAELGANYFTNVEYCVTTDACGNMSLYGDYATNHVPPEYMINLSLSQKLLDDKLTVGGRIYHVGPRAADHGDVTAQGFSQFIAPVRWEPYTLVDVFADYKFSDDVTASFRIENLTDAFYVDPLGNIPQPGPGRTFTASLTGKIGGDQSIPQWSNPFGIEDEAGRKSYDWTGFYAGVYGGYAKANTSGTTSVLDRNAKTFKGLAAGLAAAESANLDFIGAETGVQAGYNWQLDNGLVLGLEGDWGRSWTEGQQDTLAQDDARVIAAGYLQSRTHHNIDWTGSIRARLGYAFDNGLMLYGTAGVRVVNESVARDQFQYDSRLAFVEETSALRAGLTAGFGGEYALNEHWSIKGEYSWSGFSQQQYTFEDARAGTYRDYDTREVIGLNPFGQPIYRNVSHEGGYDIKNGRNALNSLGISAVKVGLNYKF